MLFDIMNLKTENISERSKEGEIKTADPPKPFPCNTDATFIDPCQITLLESRQKCKLVNSNSQDKRGAVGEEATKKKNKNKIKNKKLERGESRSRRKKNKWLEEIPADRPQFKNCT